MIDHLRVHYKFKFLLKIKNSKIGWEISKVAPIFTQLGLEDGSSVDDLVKEFFNVHFASSKLTWRFSEFFIVLDVIIWRSSNMNTTICIKPWTMRNLIFAYLALTNRITFSPFYFTTEDELLLTPRSWFRKQSKMYALSFYFGTFTTWTQEWGYRVNFKKFGSRKNTLHGTFLTYLKHFQMLGRKINFRRKVLKKKFEEYT